MDWNVHLYAFDDLAMVREAVATVPDGVPIHVCDGRYVDFEGEQNLTPGLEAFCDGHRDAVYHAPPADRLPFGDPDTPADLRSSVHEKAAWVNYEVLPSDEWTLKMDSDERLVVFDEALLVDASPPTRYVPRISRLGGSPVFVARLWQPRYWTVWLDDCLLPRTAVPRGAPLEQLAALYQDPQYETLRFARRERALHRIHIENVGADRSDTYQRRRLDQLQRFGRDDRAAELAERLD